MCTLFVVVLHTSIAHIPVSIVFAHLSKLVSRLCLSNFARHIVSFFLSPSRDWLKCIRYDFSSSLCVLLKVDFLVRLSCENIVLRGLSCSTLALSCYSCYNTSILRRLHRSCPNRPIGIFQYPVLYPYISSFIYLSRESYTHSG